MFVVESPDGGKSALAHFDISGTTYEPSGDMYVNTFAIILLSLTSFCCSKHSSFVSKLCYLLQRKFLHVAYMFIFKILLQVL